ncbi:MAG: flavodoxin reductase [Bacteroidetes bacterium]|nr:flavodoxin reductase [Bacteroidota bacterium]
MTQSVKIISIEHLTHDVLRVVADRPAELTYQPGQAVDVAIDKPGWEQEFRAFTFTSLPGEELIEFTIKTYPSHNGVTNKLLSLAAGDSLIIGGVFGDIAYKGEGMFIAGGAGVTPFIAILKQLEKVNRIGDNKLLFANKTKADIILEREFRRLLGTNFINVLSEENHEGYEVGFITAELIKKHGNNAQYFYLCGPPQMMAAVQKHLAALGIPEESIIKESF